MIRNDIESLTQCILRCTNTLGKKVRSNQSVITLLHYQFANCPISIENAGLINFREKHNFICTLMKTSTKHVLMSTMLKIFISFG